MLSTTNNGTGQCRHLKEEHWAMLSTACKGSWQSCPPPTMALCNAIDHKQQHWALQSTTHNSTGQCFPPPTRTLGNDVFDVFFEVTRPSSVDTAMACSRWHQDQVTGCVAGVWPAVPWGFDGGITSYVTALACEHQRHQAQLCRT
uniref:Uncharacterized protein n=1 Tax=Eutreptiella gymnastica TaxID=73025 RepID=A0A7S4FMT5_9EUGL